MKTKINPSEWYTMQDLVKRRMFPWSKSYSSIKNFVISDRKTKNILKATITGSGNGTKYHIKGENIINFVRAFESGEVRFKN